MISSIIDVPRKYKMGQHVIVISDRRKEFTVSYETFVEDVNPWLLFFSVLLDFVSKLIKSLSCNLFECTAHVATA